MEQSKETAPDEEETGGGNGKISTGMEMNLTQGTANAPPKYSWDVRRAEEGDSSRFRVQNIDGGFVLKNDINGQQLVIDNCKRAVIAVLDVTGSVMVDDCLDCTLIVGPCNGSLFIRGSTNCKIFYVGQQFRMRDCKEVDIAIYCRTQPIIESSANIRFYPLNLFYPNLHDHLTTIGMSAFGSPPRSIHDYTPTPGMRNYSIIDDELRMDLASSRELRASGISIEHNDSVFIQKEYIDNADNLVNVMLLSVQRNGESHTQFYDRCYRACSEAHQKGMKVVNFSDVSEALTDEELGEILKEEVAADLRSKMIVLEVMVPPPEISKYMEGPMGQEFNKVPLKYQTILRDRFFS
ncbi:rpi-2 [Pristionchus pacificus]|uniref:Rpi-2 n=1 Tax=Pristionchus pacificus TaxID=54126 RepID=A0A2A6C3G0_PRIPA|nr:rpi-2 [Pristionchus pacificus]|eukprot:PDM72772.1 rpi-2 [Pristionchus pacificus]